jgi:WD40 repeat protein
MKTKWFILSFLFLVTAHCFAAENSEIENFKRKWTLSNLSHVFSVVINPNGTQIAAETIFGYQVFDLKTGKELYTFIYADEIVEHWGYTPRGARNSISRKGPIGHIKFIYSPDGSQIMAPMGGNKIKIWDSKTGKELRTLEFGRDGKDIIVSAVYSPDSKYVAVSTNASGVNPNHIRIWNVNSGLQLLSIEREKDTIGRFIYYSKDGKSIGTYTYKGTSFNAETGAEQDVPQYIFYPIGLIAGEIQESFLDSIHDQADANADTDWRDFFEWRSFSPDGLRFAAVKMAGSGGSMAESGGSMRKYDSKAYYVQIFDSKTGQQLTVDYHLERNVLLVAPKVIMYNPQGTRIFAGLVDGSVKIWDSATGQEITTRNYANAGGISCAQFSKDGNYLVIGTSNGNIVLMGK